MDDKDVKNEISIPRPAIRERCAVYTGRSVRRRQRFPPNPPPRRSANEEIELTVHAVVFDIGDLKLRFSRVGIH